MYIYILNVIGYTAIPSSKRLFFYDAIAILKLKLCYHINIYGHIIIIIFILFMQFENRFIEMKPQMDVCNSLWLNRITNYNFFRYSILQSIDGKQDFQHSSSRCCVHSIIGRL